MADDVRTAVADDEFELKPHLEIPRPLPEELISSTFCRYMRINDVRSADIANRALRSECLRRGHVDPRGYIENISVLLGLDVTQIVKDHTCQRFSSIVLQDKAIESGRTPITLQQPPAKALLVDQARLCVTCIEKDINKFDGSFWRVFHQLPGVSRCRDCGTPLFKTANDPKRILPHEVLELDPSPPLVGTEDSEAMRRYESLVHRVLADGLQVGRIAITLELRKKAISRGLRPDSTIAVGHLTSLLELCAPYLDRCGVSRSQIEETVLGRTLSTTAAYMLAATLLSGSVDEAARVFHAGIDVRSPKERWLDAGRKNILDREKTLIESNGSFDEYAEKCESSKVAVARYFVDRGVPDFFGDVSYELRSAFLRFMDGDSIESACGAVGIPTADLQSFLRETSLPAWRIADGVHRRAPPINASDTNC